MALIGLGVFGVGLWSVGVRDWRVYGVVALWPPIILEPGVSHLTPAVMLLTAVAWRWRYTDGHAGVAVGLAIALKLFPGPSPCGWPRPVGTARRSSPRSSRRPPPPLCFRTPGSGLMPRRSLMSDGRSTRTATRSTGSSSRPDCPAPWVGWSLRRSAVGLLAATWRYRSFTLAVATALAVSPIVWLDYFALAAIPLAVVRPRLSPVWFVPLGTAGLEGAGLGIGDAAGTARALIAFGIVVAVAFRAERRASVSMPAEEARQRPTAWARPGEPSGAPLHSDGVPAPPLWSRLGDSRRGSGPSEG